MELEVLFEILVAIDLGSTGTAKWASYLYRVLRGYGYYRGTAACVPQAYLFSAKKKKILGTVLVQIRSKSGTGRVGSGTGPVRGEPKRRRLK